mmetsp:Transcript_9147/g.33760  ORF Transcript_9147/g.33760 Transcript_9147/m.33760 type:complete len:315 (-) Transcript_9147:1094-2038(-)
MTMILANSPHESALHDRILPLCNTQLIVPESLHLLLGSLGLFLGLLLQLLILQSCIINHGFLNCFALRVKLFLGHMFASSILKRLSLELFGNLFGVRSNFVVVSRHQNLLSHLAPSLVVKHRMSLSRFLLHLFLQKNLLVFLLSQIILVGFVAMMHVGFLQFEKFLALLGETLLLLGKKSLLFLNHLLSEIHFQLLLGKHRMIRASLLENISTLRNIIGSLANILDHLSNLEIVVHGSHFSAASLDKLFLFALRKQFCDVFVHLTELAICFSFSLSSQLSLTNLSFPFALHSCLLLSGLLRVIFVIFIFSLGWE